MSDKPLRASTRIILTRDLENLHESFLKLIEDNYQVLKLSLAISSIKQSADFLKEKAQTFSKTIEEEIFSLENLALKILSLQQPLLKDLRFVIGMLKIAEKFQHLNQHNLRLINMYSTDFSSSAEEILEKIKEINEDLASYLEYFLEAIRSNSFDLIKELVEKIEKREDSYNNALKNAADSKNFAKSLLLFELIRLQEKIKDLLLMLIKETYTIYQV